MNTDDPMIVEEIWPIAKLISPHQSTIVVAGAWKGLYLHYLSQRFPSARVIGFEPQTDAFLSTQERIKDFGLNAEVRNYGLGFCDERATIGRYGSDGASVLSPHEPIATAEFRDAISVVSKIGPISLFVMNMEGYEYVLLPYLMGSKILRRIKSLAVQFHPSFLNINFMGPLQRHYGIQVYPEHQGWTYWECR